MSKLKKLRNRVLVFVVFLLSCTRLTIARILPSAWTTQKPNPTVFALSDAAWADLRAGAEFMDDDKDKKDAPKSDDKKDASKDDKKDTSKDDKKDASKSDDKKDAGAGGGDGEVADGVGG